MFKKNYSKAIEGVRPISLDLLDEERNLGILNEVTKRRACREHKDFKPWTDTNQVLGVLDCSVDQQWIQHQIYVCSLCDEGS